MSLIRDYFQKTKKYKSEKGDRTLVLMQVGAFYEVYGLKDQATGEITGSDIEAFSHFCDFNISDKKIIKRINFKHKVISIKKQNYFQNNQILKKIINISKSVNFKGLSIDTRTLKKENLFLLIISFNIFAKTIVVFPL